MRRRVAAVGALLLATALTSCGSPAGPGGGVTVLAAASLTEVFAQLGHAFEADHPGVRVKLSFGGSSTLAAQIVAGAPADVFASASPATMKTVTDAGRAAGSPRVFVRNQLVIAVPPGNPGHLASLSDLTRPGLRVAVCVAAVPCGAAADKALAAAGVSLTPVTRQADVKATLSTLELGEVDAALVYRTDVIAAAGKVDGVEFAASACAVNDYPIVALAGAPHPDAAAQFVAFVLSPAAHRAFLAAGFQPAAATPSSADPASPPGSSPPGGPVWCGGAGAASAAPGAGGGG